MTDKVTVSEAMLDPELDSEGVLYRFNKLIQEMLRGSIKRNCFRPWEITLLLDIEACNLHGANRRETLRRYQRAVQRNMDKGSPMPMTMSEYLASRRNRGKNGRRSEADLPPPAS